MKETTKQQPKTLNKIM